ncbi:rap guanine nucleotide exchange factor 6 isoform X2 [Nematostella vectensis]|uniref:rap guanine nucleotide exchange factor 6 isoform X2 n=1 Tax=Nematostella vectensis TaxID=45351 RepID=UPI002077311A|nr:rap guanine nucleotide exchange factor 6 isoform X2 [Nematostella vectensis]
MANNIDKMSATHFIKCLQKPPEFRTNEDVETIFHHLCSMQAMAGYLESSIRAMSQTARYEEYASNFLLYTANDYSSCWYILLSGCVFLEGCMFLPGSSFGKRPHGHDGTRGTDCLVLENSGMIVIDYPHENLLQPFQRHSYSTTELEKLLALEEEDYHIGGPVPEDEKLPMELQSVKKLLLQGERNLNARQKHYEAKHPPHPVDSDSKHGHPPDHQHELDLTGLVESIVDSDDEEEAESHSSGDSFLVRDVVRDCLEKEPSERTENDIQTLLDFMQHLPAFANMTQNVRRSLCAVMVFAVVEKADAIVMKDGEELDSWCVILNGSVIIEVENEPPVELHLGDSFGVEPSLKKMYHHGVMRTRVNDCQFVCIAQSDYYRILTQGESNIQVIEEDGEVVMVTEHRSTDGGNRQGQVVIKAKSGKLITHLVEDHSVIDPTFVEDFLLTFKTFFDQPTKICGKLLNWFLEDDLRDKVTRVMLLWVNNHYNDFEGDHVMEDYLQAFESALEVQKMSGQLDLLLMACSVKAKSRVISLERQSHDQPWGFSIAGGRENGFGIFVYKIDPECSAFTAGVRKADQVLKVNDISFENITYDKARDLLSSSIRLTLVLKKNIAGFKDLLASPVIITRDCSKEISNDKDVQRSSSDCSERRSHLQTRLSAPDISNGTMKKPPVPHQAHTKREKVKKALNRISTLGTLSRHYKLISKSDRDLSSLDSGYNEGDETHTNAKLGIKSRSRNSLPRSFGSMESISTIDQNVEYPDRVVKLYKADQTYKYFMIFKETTARELVNMAVDAFGLQDLASNYSLCEVTVEESGLVRQRRQPDSLANLADRISLNSRYYLKNNNETAQLLQGDATHDLGKECHVTLLQLKTQEVARHLTLQDFELFRVIDPREYIYDVWEFGPEFSPNLAKFEETVNRETFWVVTEICGESNVVKRMKLIKHFIKIAKYCKDCKNINSAFAIISGLGHTAVKRLKNTWEKLPNRYYKMYEDLENLMDPSRSMFKYRSLLNSEHVNPPLIPFFPVIKRDLTLIYLNNKSVVDGLINFEKLRMIAREVRQVSKCHSMPYDPSNMFEQDSVRGAPQSMTSTVVGMVTGSSAWARRSMTRDQNPKKYYEECIMSRRVLKYLEKLEVQADEEKLREMSNTCEPGLGSAPPSVQTRRKNSPHTSPNLTKKDKKHTNNNKLGSPSPLALRRGMFNSADQISISSTSTTSSVPEVTSPKPGPEHGEEFDVFPESDSSSLRDERSSLCDDTLSASLRDDRSSTSLRDDKSYTSLPDDKSSTSLRDDRPSTLLRDDRLSTSLRDDRSSTLLRDDRLSTSSRDDRSSTSLRDDRPSTSLNGDRSSMSSRDDRSSTSLRDDRLPRNDRHSSSSSRDNRSATSMRDDRSSSSSLRDERRCLRDERLSNSPNDERRESRDDRTALRDDRFLPVVAGQVARPPPDGRGYSQQCDRAPPRRPNDVQTGSYHHGHYTSFQYPPKYTVEYVQEYDDSEEGQVSAV